jgi:hypothetical protein
VLAWPDAGHHLPCAAGAAGRGLKPARRLLLQADKAQAETHAIELASRLNNAMTQVRAAAFAAAGQPFSRTGLASPHGLEAWRRRGRGGWGGGEGPQQRPRRPHRLCLPARRRPQVSAQRAASHRGAKELAALEVLYESQLRAAVGELRSLRHAQALQGDARREHDRQLAAAEDKVCGVVCLCGRQAERRQGGGLGHGRACRCGCRQPFAGPPAAHLLAALLPLGPQPPAPHSRHTPRPTPAPLQVAAERARCKDLAATSPRLHGTISAAKERVTEQQVRRLAASKRSRCCPASADLPARPAHPPPTNPLPLQLEADRARLELELERSARTTAECAAEALRCAGGGGAAS